MSNTDSFIDEVSEEVRRDQLYRVFRKYGWIAIAAVILIVGGASVNEYRKAQATAAAQATGDALLNALNVDEAHDRITALEGAELQSDEAEVVRQFLLGAEQVVAGNADAAAEVLLKDGTVTGETAPIYRELAELKAVMLGADSIPADERRTRLETLAQPGAPLALLAAEQLALLEVETGNADAAIDRLQALIQDAEATAGLRQRASQLIVALGGEPETLPTLRNTQ
ncbi:hypothetical protein [Cognatishimia maritima]|uniref:Tetratricopeptide repeat-like domain-containing protein n=1 Tax=Cognatishimia maritima TaxID=870908 RepID=A0A1M5JNX2_9RHOB|nr:hypothetical protein [Cognatishimia maritima]SHG41959.1 hypothetical protein SAMN04488044_0725 [Cognatishimia maritima]